LELQRQKKNKYGKTLTYAAFCTIEL